MKSLKILENHMKSLEIELKSLKHLGNHRKSYEVIQNHKKHSAFNGSSFVLYFNLLIKITLNYILKYLPGLSKFNPDF